MSIFISLITGKNTNSGENWDVDDKTAIKQEKKERKNDLKEFMKMKKREKSMMNGQEGIIWMKGMEDILNLNIDSSNNSQKETNYSVNSNKEKNNNKNFSSSKDLIEIDKEPRHSKNNCIYNNNNNICNNNGSSNNNSKKNYYEYLKDKEDYLNVHKMYIDLDNIQNENEEENEIEEDQMNQENIDVDDVHTLTRDFSLLSVIRF